jgi:polyferredoxin
MRPEVVHNLIVGIRIAVVVMIGIAVLATITETGLRTTINPFNFFGYFTIQSNLFGAVVLAIAAFSSKRSGGTIAVLRACATTYLVLVGIVYAVLLAPLGAAGGVPVPWANVMMHIVTPLYFAADWLLASDRRPLPWKQLWVVLVYPIVWCVVVLVRGATDGWVPYPFLDPATGYGSVGLFVALIAAAVALLGSGVWASSRLPSAGSLQRSPATGGKVDA